MGIKSAIITANTSGQTQIVAAVPGRRIRVVSYVLSFSGTVNAKFQSNSTDLTGSLYGVAAGVIPMATGESVIGGIQGQFETAPGEALNLNLSGAVAVGGHLKYIEVT